MSNGNPFYVHPGTDFGPGLMGLAETLGVKRKEREEFDRIAAMKKGALEAFQSGDPDKIAEFSIQNPEISKQLMEAGKFRNEQTKENYIDSIFQAIQDPSRIPEIAASRQAFLRSQGVGSEGSVETDSFVEKYNQDPEGTLQSLKAELAFIAPEKWKAYKAAITGEGKPFTLSPDQTRYTASGELIVEAPKGVPTPNSDIAKLGEDLVNKLISNEDYLAKKERILNPTATSKAELTARALNGDMEAHNVLEAMGKSDIEMAMAKGEAAAIGKIAGLQEAMDLKGTARAILDGRETIENVKNTFGVPIQETVRSLVLKQEPDFNFVQPRAIVKSLNSSLMQQQKNRGAMGSFVANINRQVDEVEKRSRDIIKRVGIRALDVPWRELNVRFIGSGHERVFEAYMKEISAEIAKLSQGSAASIAQLPEENRKDWERIHDPNLSLRQLVIVMKGTRDMANMRLKSVQDEIDSTIDRFSNVRNKRGVSSISPDIQSMTDEELQKIVRGE